MKMIPTEVQSVDHLRNLHCAIADFLGRYNDLQRTFNSINSFIDAEFKKLNTAHSDAPPCSASTWTEEDELRLLKAALEMADEPVESFDVSVSPLERMGRALTKPFEREQVLAKLKELKKRYELGKVYDSPAFDISSKIWGKLQHLQRN